MWLVFFLILFVYIFPQNVHAEHVLSGQFEKKPPVDGTKLTYEETRERAEIKTKLNKKWTEYHEKVMEYAADLMSKNTGSIRDGTRISEKDAVLMGTRMYYEEYFGTPKDYFDGEFGIIAEDLWEYGMIVHFRRDDGGARDSCVDPGDLVWFGDGVCEGFPKIAEYAYKDGKFDYRVYPLDYHELENGEKKESKSYPYLITSHGVFTDSETDEFGKCNVNNISEAYMEDDKIGSPLISEDRLSGMKPKSVYEAAGDKVGDEMRETMRGVVESFDKHFFDSNCEESSLSVLSQLLNVTKPLNITNNRFVMAVSHVTTQIAIAATILIVAAYGLMYTTGYQMIDPVKFGVRLFFTLLAISYLPWLVQDTLNLNNQMVHHVASIEFEFEEFKDEEGNVVESISGTSVNLLAGSMDGVFQGLLDDSGKEDLLLLFMLFLAIFMAAIPLVRLVFYWYFRALKIFLMVMIGPFMILMMAMPHTASRGKKWINQLIGEIFTQFFVVIGFLLVGLLVSNVQEFAYINHFGWTGIFIFLLASAFFLAELPSFSKSFIDSVTGMGENNAASSGQKVIRGAGNQAKDIARGVTKGLKGENKGVKTIAGGVVNKASRGIHSNVSNFVKGAKGEERNKKPGVSGRVGYSIGAKIKTSFKSPIVSNKNTKHAQGATSNQKGAKTSVISHQTSDVNSSQNSNKASLTRKPSTTPMNSQINHQPKPPVKQNVRDQGKKKHESALNPKDKKPKK